MGNAAKLGLKIIGWISAIIGIVVGVPELVQMGRAQWNERTPIAITRPAGDMFRCALFEGTAGRRHGQQLWLAHRDNRDPIHFFFMKPYLWGEMGWKARVHLGPPDTVRSRYTVYVFYVSDDTSRFLENLTTSSVNGPAGTFWMAQDLPPTASGTVSLEVTRRGDTGVC
ncbi:hypothetical protein [Mycobacterium sp. 236(2023)]|uniref:hypothetical protein n=1 Tax=Mycobacterium sp. 236(2023) TaxID=3038163 RepID=UPI002415812C|nr:hypothetical protein [Mycobacterium sp. 236(2023)]MDG4667990.1 hypothetical protein [Mycobacterium sp. 236(2023)]